MTTEEALSSVIDGLSLVSPFLLNVARVAAAIRQAQSEGRALTAEEIAQARAITAAKRALLEAS
jgi:hypothetical protein